MAFQPFVSSPDRSFKPPTRLLGQVVPRRRILALLAATLASGAFAARVDAGPANGVSIADRVQAQRDWCTMAVSGDFTERQTAFGSTITTCTGKSQKRTCVNTKQSTTCHTDFTGAPEDVAPPPSGGVAQPTPGGGGGGGTWVVDGSASSGLVARAVHADRGHTARKHHGRSTKRHAGTRRK